MENDILFKSKLFGGYKKEEVMAYIATLGADKAALSSEVDSVRAQLASLGAKMRELEGVKLESEAQKLAFAQSVENCRRLESDNAALAAELSAKSSESAVLTAKISELESECKRLSGDCERLRAVETQLGAAMLDARLYSDRLVAEAKEQSVRVRSEVYESIGETVGRIDGLTGSLGQITESFNKAVEEVGLRIRALTGDMSKAAGSLMEGQLSFNAENSTPATASELTAAIDSLASRDTFLAPEEQPIAEPAAEAVTQSAPAYDPFASYEAPEAEAEESAPAAPAQAPEAGEKPASDAGSGIEFITDDADSGNPDNGGNDPITSVYLYG